MKFMFQKNAEDVVMLVLKRLQVLLKKDPQDEVKNTHNSLCQKSLFIACLFGSYGSYESKNDNCFYAHAVVEGVLSFTLVRLYVCCTSHSWFSFFNFSLPQQNVRNLYTMLMTTKYRSCLKLGSVIFTVFELCPLNLIIAKFFISIL